MEKTMYRFIALLAFIIATGCASDPAEGNGQGTTIVDPDAIILGLDHGDVGLSVFKNWWQITTAVECKALKGDITDSEISQLKGFMADDVLQKLSTDCTGDNYRLTIGVRQSVCWPVDLKSPGIDGLKTFYQDKVDKLAAAPAGHCGANQSVGESNWAKGKAAAAGSGN
jgi:hypothetical protein